MKGRGQNSGILLTRRTDLGSRSLEIRTTLYNDTVLYTRTRYVKNTLTTDNQFTLDFATKKYKTPCVQLFYGEDTINMDIVDGRVYIIRYSKKEEKDKMEIIDIVSTESFVVEMILFFQYDLYKIGQISGTTNITISEISFFALLRIDRFAILIGDRLISSRIM